MEKPAKEYGRESGENRQQDIQEKRQLCMSINTKSPADAEAIIAQSVQTADVEVGNWNALYNKSLCFPTLWNNISIT